MPDISTASLLYFALSGDLEIGGRGGACDWVILIWGWFVSRSFVRCTPVDSVLPPESWVLGDLRENVMI